MSQDEKIKELFNRYDQNQNGTGEKEELLDGLTGLLKQVGAYKNEEEVAQIASEAIDQFDTNKNGTIEIEEFTELINYGINEKGLILE